MALVAYDYSGSESEEEDEPEDTPSRVIINKPEENGIKPENNIPEINESVKEAPSLFSKLPETKSRTNEIVEDKIEDFIPKSKPTEKPKVKITIPSLSQFNNTEDDEQPTKRAKTASSKGSGLMALLPPVKGTVLTAKSFVPNVLKNKPVAKPSSSSLVPHSVRLKAEAKKKSILLKNLDKKVTSTSDAESDDDDDIPETYDDEMWEKVCGRPKPKQIIPEPMEEVPYEEVNIAPEPAKPYDGLDNSAFKELVGKTKRPLGNIKLIDINEEELLAEKDMWMRKALTDPEMAPRKVEDEVDPTRRKRHHITYLAQQAKANEQELQSAWGASRNNKLQTRAKYGF